MKNSNHSNQQGAPPPISPRRIVVCVFSLGAIFGAGHGYGYQGVISMTQSSLIDVGHGYDRLYLGMSPTDARSLLGPGTEISRSESGVAITWHSTDGYTVTAVFEDDRLVEKKQSGTH